MNITTASAISAEAVTPSPTSSTTSQATTKTKAASKAKSPRPAPAKAAKPATPVKPAKAITAAKAAKPAKPPKPSKAPKPSTSTSASARTVVASATPAVSAVAKAVKARNKLVRDSFTMPQIDFALIDALKQRALNFRHAAKKGELLRAGLQALAALPDAELKSALARITSLKPGRPKKVG